MFIATEQDDALLRPSSGRDLLGLQVLWQQRARDLVPSLTANSSQPEGFQLLLTALAWWPEFARHKHRRDNEQRNFFVLLEQLFARAWLTCAPPDAGWPLPGRRRLEAKTVEGVCMSLSRTHFLLDNPFGNGTWGNYRGPALNAGLINGDAWLVDAQLEARTRTSTPVVEWLFPALREALDNPESSVAVAHRKNHSTAQELYAVLQKCPQAGVIRQSLAAPPQAPITARLARLAVEPPEQAPVQDLLKQARMQWPEYAPVIDTVFRCERYIAALEQAVEIVCDTVCRGGSDPASELAAGLPALRHAQDQFRLSGHYDGLAAQRRNWLADIRLDNAATLLQDLVSVHGKVSAARGNAPWLEYGDSGRLLCRLDLQPQQQIFEPEHAWRNSYYVDSLAALARALRARGQRFA